MPVFEPKTMLLPSMPYYIKTWDLRSRTEEGWLGGSPALPLQRCPAEPWWDLQAFALGSSHGVSLLENPKALLEGRVPSGLPSPCWLSWRDRKEGWPPSLSGPMYGPLSRLADLNDFLYPVFSPRHPPTASCGRLIKLA